MGRASVEGLDPEGVVTLGSHRLDENGAVWQTLEAKKVLFAPREAAVEHSGWDLAALLPSVCPPDGAC